MKTQNLLLNRSRHLSADIRSDLLSGWNFFIAPLLSIIFLTIGSSFFTTFISIKMENEGASQFVIGCIHSAFYAGMLLGAISSEPLIRRMGHIRSNAAFASIMGMTILFQSFSTTPFFWMILRIIFGFCMAGMYVVIESWLLAKSTSITRGSVLSFYMIVLYAT